MLFFNSVIGVIFAIPFLLFLWKSDRDAYYVRQKNRVCMEFKDLLVFLRGNLNAGYALENAFSRAALDMERQYGSAYLMKKDVLWCVNGIRCNQEIDELFQVIANNTEVDDVKECASLLAAARKHGGNTIQMLNRIATNLTEQESVRREIETSVAEKKLESKIMLMAPFGIVLYMRLTNASYMQALYNTFPGKLIMVVCLLIITGMGLWMNRIVKE